MERVGCRIFLHISLDVFLVPLVVIFTKCDGKVTEIQEQLMNDMEEDSFEHFHQMNVNAKNKMEEYLMEKEREVRVYCSDDMKVRFLSTSGIVYDICHLSD